MTTLLAQNTAMTPRDKELAQTIRHERGRLLGFIQRLVPEPGDAEDILQDVFYELVAAYRLPEPIEQVGAWLVRVARNRIIDRFRRKRPQQSLSTPLPGDDDGASLLEDLLPAPGGGPEAAYARDALLDELLDALDELPAEQRAVFVAHELEGRSFKALAAEYGVGVNTLLARKRYAVLHLRHRLQAIHDELINN